jgi:hypothetical protein
LKKLHEGEKVTQREEEEEGDGDGDAGMKTMKRKHEASTEDQTRFYDLLDNISLDLQQKDNQLTAGNNIGRCRTPTSPPSSTWRR